MQLVPMSALPPRTDMCGATGDVRFGPKADIFFQHASHTRAANDEVKSMSRHKLLSSDVRNLNRPVSFVCNSLEVIFYRVVF